jgi:hypothetical protein
MKVLHRKSVNKHKAAKSFRRGVGKTKLVNLQHKPQRGGYRL